MSFGKDYCLYCCKELRRKEGCDICGPEAAGKAPESHPMFLRPGAILKDQYLVGRVLGHGGFGITYLGVDINLDIRVAIKEHLPRDLASRNTDRISVIPYSKREADSFNYGLKKFLEESRMLSRFGEHPNIVTVLNFFMAHGTGYLIMRYLEGITLEQYRMNYGGRVSAEQAGQIIIAVLDGLRVLHDNGMLHRDIKPDNIFITKEGQIKLLDFGAARYAIGEHSRSLTKVFTPGYAPIEQMSTGGKQGPWTDIYSTGATFYTILTGKEPLDSLARFGGKDTLRSPYHILGSAIGEELSKAIITALSVQHEDRFQNANEFQAAIWKSLNPEDIREPKVHELKRSEYSDSIRGAEESKKVSNDDHESVSSRSKHKDIGVDKSRSGQAGKTKIVKEFNEIARYRLKHLLAAITLSSSLFIAVSLIFTRSPNSEIGSLGFLVGAFIALISYFRRISPESIFAWIISGWASGLLTETLFELATRLFWSGSSRSLSFILNNDTIAGLGSILCVLYTHVVIKKLGEGKTFALMGLIFFFGLWVAKICDIFQIGFLFPTEVILKLISMAAGAAIGLLFLGIIGPRSIIISMVIGNLGGLLLYIIFSAIFNHIDLYYPSEMWSCLCVVLFISCFANFYAKTKFKWQYVAKRGLYLMLTFGATAILIIFMSRYFPEIRACRYASFGDFVSKQNLKSRGWSYEHIESFRETIRERKREYLKAYPDGICSSNFRMSVE